MDTTSTHYKGKYRNIYAVHEAYPNGGAVGDYVDIGGFAHYWNADRGTWCVNANRDQYWDEKFADVEEGLSTETTARQTADTTLQNNITAEATARQAADTTLQNNITAEATARQAADALKADKTYVDGQISELDETITGVRDEAEAAATAASTKAEKSYVDSMLAQKLSDAPTDGKTYGRKNGTWAEADGLTQEQKTAIASITNKADTSYVNTELAKKMNKADLEGDLATWKEFEIDPEIDDIASKILEKPTASGTQGQVLSLDAQGKTIWKDEEGGGGSSVTVVDNLTSDSATDALSAKQGKVLKTLVDSKANSSDIPSVPVIADNLTTDDATKTLSAKQGKVLKESLDGKVSDAPEDDKTYGRKNGEWVEVLGGGGTAVDETLTVEVNQWTGISKASLEGCDVHITVSGVTSTYQTDENGKVITVIPAGSMYSVEVDAREGLYLYGNIYKWDFVANSSSRKLVINFRDSIVGLYFVTRDGAEYSKEEWEAGTYDAQSVVAIKVATTNLVEDGNQFAILIDDVVGASYMFHKLNYLSSNVLISSFASGYSAKGLLRTQLILGFANANNYVAQAASYCYGCQTLIGGAQIQGFLGATEQWLAIINNEDALNEMLRLVRPSATSNFSTMLGVEKWTSDQLNATNAYYCTRVLTNNNKNFTYYVVPFYAL